MKRFLIVALIILYITGCVSEKHIDIKFSNNMFHEHYRINDYDYKEIRPLVIKYYNNLINAFNKSDGETLGSLEITDDLKKLSSEILSYIENNRFPSNDDSHAFALMSLVMPVLTTSSAVSEYEKAVNQDGNNGTINKQIFNVIKDSIIDAAETYQERNVFYDDFIK